MDTNEEVGVMKVPCVVFREYRWGIKLSKKGVMEDVIMEGWGKNSNVVEKAREDMMEEGNGK
jgi:hypothetical protein